MPMGLFRIRIDFFGQECEPHRFKIQVQFKEILMASRTGKTRMARKVKQARKGKARKRREQNKGTTPKFAVHKK